MQDPRAPWSRAALAFAPFAVTALVYIGLVGTPMWETDAWLVSWLSEHFLSAPSWASFRDLYGPIVDSPKGLSDLTYLTSWLALYGSFGPDSAAFRLVALGLHLLAGTLLYLEVRSLEGSRWQASAVSALFLLLPLNEEVVAVPAKLEYSTFVCLCGGRAAGSGPTTAQIPTGTIWGRMSGTRRSSIGLRCASRHCSRNRETPPWALALDPRD